MSSSNFANLAVVLLAIAVLSLQAETAKASIWPGPVKGIAVNDEIYVTHGEGATSGGVATPGGGEYAVFIKDGGTAEFGNLFSFCLQSEATIDLFDPLDPLTCYRVAGIGTSVAGVDGGPLTLDTLFLFEQYATCKLDDFDLDGMGKSFAYSEEAWVIGMQLAIWSLEEQPLPLQYLGGLTEEADLLLSLAAARRDEYSGGVVALNLVDQNGADIQDLLWYQPITPTNNPVPEPATFGIWFVLGMSGLAGGRLRKRLHRNRRF